MRIYNLFEGDFEDRTLIMSTTDKKKLTPDVRRVIEGDVYMELEIWQDGEKQEYYLVGDNILEYLEIK